MKSNNRFRHVFAIAVVILLISVRLFEQEWFPEKFIDYFASGNYMKSSLPVLRFEDYFSIFLRYSVNSILSVILLQLLFKDARLTLWAVKFFIYSGVILGILFVLTVQWIRPVDYRIVFYLRRMLIQPVGLFLLLPVFYFIREATKPAGS